MQPPRSTLTDTRCPYTTLCRSTPPPSRCCAPRRAPRRCRSATKRWSSRTPSRFPPPTEGLTVHLGMLLQMAADGAGERIALGSRSGGLTLYELGLRSQRAGTLSAGPPHTGGSCCWERVCQYVKSLGVGGPLQNKNL